MITITYLLDTHVVIWLVNNDKRLGKCTRQLLGNKANNLLVSYITPWEISIKAATGKLTYDDRFFEVMKALDITLVNLKRELFQSYQIYNPANRDPYDNMLLAVAETENCIFVTADNKILSGPAPVKLLDAKA